MTKLKNTNCDKTQKIKLLQKSKAQIVTKLKNSMWRNFKTQIVTKLKNSNCDKTQKIKLLPNSKNQIVTNLKYSNCDKTQ